MDNLIENNPIKRLTPSELLDTFPEALPAIKRNIKILERELKETKDICERLLDAILQGIYENNENMMYNESFWIPLAYIIFHDRLIKPIQRQINFLKKLIIMQSIREKGIESGDISQSLIEKAKMIPIKRIVPVNSQGFILCPWHTEDTPSCKVYKETKLYCFGCNCHGDVIDLIQIMYRIDFISAVKKLANL